MLVPPGEPVPLDELIHPRAEPEIALARSAGRSGRAPTSPTCSRRSRPCSRRSRWSTPATPSRSGCPTRSPTTRARPGSCSAPQPRRPGELRGAPRAGLRVPLPAAGSTPPPAAPRWATPPPRWSGWPGALAARGEQIEAGLDRADRRARPASVPLRARASGHRRVRRPRDGRGARWLTQGRRSTRSPSCPTGSRSPPAASDTLLRALARAGLRYRVGCKRGGCGICKVQLLAARCATSARSPTACSPTTSGSRASA